MCRGGGPDCFQTTRERPMRERYVLTRRGLIARSALLGGGLMAGTAVPWPGPGAGSLRPVSRPPTAPRSATSPGDRAILWSRADREARMLVDLSTTESFGKELDRAGAGSARGHRLHGQARPAGPAAGPAHLLPRALPRPGRPEDRERARHRQLHDPARAAAGTCASSGRATRRARAGASTPTSAACGSTRRCARSSRSSSSTRATRSTPTGRSMPRRATRTAAPGWGRTASPGATSSSRRSRRWPRPCASSAWPMPTT